MSAEQRSGACLLNIFCVLLFDLSLCLPKTAPPLSVPDACFLLFFPPPIVPPHSTPPPQMESRIQSHKPRADAIFPLSLSPLYLIILLGTATRVLLPKEEQHDASFHLTLQVPPHLSASFLLPTAPAVVQHCPLRWVWVRPPRLPGRIMECRLWFIKWLQ